MNISEIARRLRVTPDELRGKLPELGFDVGKKAIKVDRRLADRIMRKWKEVAWKSKELEKEKKKMEIRKRVQSGEIEGAREITIASSITVRELADKLGLPVNDVIGELMKGGILASINERVDFDTAAVIAEDLGYKAVKESEEQKEESVTSALEGLRETVLGEDDGKLKERPPVVVVMGHVDHGKTTLLDTIRAASVAEGESGGITQHIGAYQIEKNGRLITFIDTPGHEAFTMMRSRGARVADIAILVVAADDGVKPQTEEVINIVQAAKLPHVVAINKMDKEDANPDKVKTQLSERKLIPEDWGGKTVMVPISAKAGTGIDDLLDTILLVADLEKENIRANPDRRAIGTVIESHVSKGEGPVATVLVQAGTLKPGDVLGVGGANYGKVRAMKDFHGTIIDAAPPGMPVKILGFKNAPTVGDVMEVPENVKDLGTKKAAKRNLAQAPQVQTQSGGGEDAEDEKQLVTIVLKTDVLGSQEAILGQLEKMSHPEVGVKVVSKGLGNVSDSDVLNGETNQALVMGFNVNIPASAEDLAREKKVEVRKYTVIYDLVNDIKAELKKLLKPEIIRTELGKLEVKGVFGEGKDYQVVGGVVIEGKCVKGEKARVTRNGEALTEGVVAELQRNKQAVDEVPGGSECGIKFQGKPFIQIGDVLEIIHEDIKETELGF